jgi:hypothetical protein
MRCEHCGERLHELDGERYCPNCTSFTTADAEPVCDAVLVDDVGAEFLGYSARQTAADAARSARLDAMLDAKVKAGWRDPNRSGDSRP